MAFLNGVWRDFCRKMPFSRGLVGFITDPFLLLPQEWVSTVWWICGVGFVCRKTEGNAIECSIRIPIVPFSASSTNTRGSRLYQIVCKAEMGLSGNVPSSNPSGFSTYENIIEPLTTLFPVWVILIVGLYKPSTVTWLETNIWFGFPHAFYGIDLDIEDFRRCLRNPWTVMKLAAPLATGLILVSCYPEGQASNVATYISKGNAALSVLMTTSGSQHLSQVVLLPTIVGVLANEYFPKFTKKIITFTPLIGVILTTLLCASPISQVSEVLMTQGIQLVLPVAFLRAAAFALGYWISRISFGESTSRTISIEYGMQSSALGFLLAQKHFTNPLVAVPLAVSVVCTALGGSGLAVIWRNKLIPANDKDDFKE